MIPSAIFAAMLAVVAHPSQFDNIGRAVCNNTTTTNNNNNL